MANLIACQAPGFLRGIASYAGGAPYKQREKWPNGFAKCPGQKPTAMLAIHGTDDRGVKIDGGRFSATYWAYVAGCSADEMETTGYKECHAYRGCPAGSAVVFCEAPGGVHWPLKAVWGQQQMGETTVALLMSACAARGPTLSTRDKSRFGGRRKRARSFRASV